MSSAARAGRRRRLLHDGTTIASKDEGTSASVAQPGPRYAPREGSASMAIASRLLPRSWWSLTAVFISFAAAVVGLVLLDWQSVTLAADASARPLYWLLMDRPASIAAWWSSTLWMVMAMLAVILFGLCRSRMDDLKSGYRWWLIAATASVVLSLNAATGAHGFVGESLAKMTSFAPFGTGAFWWLVPGAVVFGAMGIRLLLDMSDSRAAIGFACLGVAAISAGCVVDAGLAPQSLASVSPLLASPLFAPVATLAGISLAVLSLLFFSRRIVLEVEGAVAPPVQKVARKATESKKTTKKASKKAEAPTAKPSLRLAEETEPVQSEPRRLSASERRAARRATKIEDQPKTTQPKKEETSWVSGGDGYQDDYEEGPTRRKLSKSERKRLRKLKARNAA